jgi:hypothetical protein
MRRTGRRATVRTVGAAVVGALVLALPASSSATGRAPEVPTPMAPVAWQRPAVSATGLVERSGVRLVRVSVSGDGGLLDLRYQVIDPNRASSVHDRRTPPAIIDERTGLVMSKLFMGHSHTGRLTAAVTYYLVIENPGHWVRRGGRVTVLLGDAEVEHVVVT